MVRTGAGLLIVPLCLRRLESGEFIKCALILTRKQHDIDAEDMARWLAKHDVFGVADGAKVIGVAGFVKNRFHISVEPAYKGRCGKIIRELLDYGLRTHDHVVACIPQCNTYVIRLANHFGFKEYTRLNGYVHMRL